MRDPFTTASQPDSRWPQLDSGEISRRDFLKVSAFLGGSALVLAGLPRAVTWAEALFHEGEFHYPLADIQNQINTVCLQCNTICGIKVKLYEGVAAKIDGNPYDPWTLTPHLPYNTPIKETATIEGAICPKGQAGLQTVYDPYRIVKVLKRKPGTKRGAGEWITIPFEQALEEIVNGGDLFGEGHVPGLKEIRALTDAKVMSAMAADVKAIVAEKDAEKKKALIAAFQEKHKDHLDKLIDPDHPDLGPKNNQFVFAWGRLKGGRSDLISRFTRDAMGSTNAHGHTTVCQGSLYFSGKAMSEQFIDGKWTGGQKFYWQADLANSEFVIFVGASPFEGNYGPPWRSNKITEGLTEGRLKIVVVDPRLSKTAAKAWKWLPIQPGTEGALAMGLIRWIIDNQRYDARYLANANKAAAAADKESTWTEATWLVKINDQGQPEKFLRASEIGLAEKEKRPTSDGKGEYEFDYFVALKDGQPVKVDPYDEGTPVEGDLFVDTTLNGIRVKSALQIIKESASEHSLQEWADICGLRARDLEEVAAEFTAHGKRAAADIHRGVSQHTNGFYNVVAWYTLNLLIGNFDWKGGMIKAATYDATGGKKGQPFPISKMTNGKLEPFGLSIIRHDAKYQDSTLYLTTPEDKRYPAPRNWYPLSSDIYQEIIPSIGDAYPYPVKALFFYMGSPVYALPAGHTNIEVLADPKKLPLFVCCDITIGETSMYADYIFPDLSYLERWEFNGSHPSVPFKVQPIRQPAIAPLTEEVTVFGQKLPLSLEALLLGLAEKLGLPGFGPGGLGEGRDFTHPDDLYLRMVANVAFGEKEDGSDAVPDAGPEEEQVFLAARRHLPPSVFDPARWKRIVGETLWPKVVTVLNRGGRFQDYNQGYKGEQVANKYGTLINIYQEKTATTKSAMTGKPLKGYAAYLPGPVDVTGKPIDDAKEGYDLRLITYREISQTKSRTSGNYWLLAVLPENFVLMNRADAARRGLKNGDLVRIISPTNPEGLWDLKNGRTVPMVGKVKVTEGLRPGVIAFALGFGHWAYGGVDVTIDGQTIKGDPRRIRGIHANAAMRVDPYLKNTTLVDPVGGSAVFYDTLVKVVKVG